MKFISFISFIGVIIIDLGKLRDVESYLPIIGALLSFVTVFFSLAPLWMDFKRAARSSVDDFGGLKTGGGAPIMGGGGATGGGGGGIGILASLKQNNIQLT